jgi:glycosyltransferase involved in cell wall biosynthesis
MEDCLSELPASGSPAASLTVVMPVYNGLPYLDQAIASIVAQTHRDFTLAIYDDHSDDGSYEQAVAWARRDPRISVVRGDRRLGPSGSSAAAAALATSEYVARMDADDIATPDRLVVELQTLLDNPDAVLVGSIFDMIDGNGNLIRRAALGQNRGGNPPIAHASILYRRAAFESVGGYRDETDYFEDQDLYLRMGRVGKVLVIDRPLLRLRFAGQHARLRDERISVLESISQQFTQVCNRPADNGAKSIEPLAFYSVGVLSVMGLERPGLLSLMLHRSKFDRPFETLAVIAFIALAEVSPRLARGINAFIRKLRAGRTSSQGAGYSAHVWIFEKK